MLSLKLFNIYLYSLHKTLSNYYDYVVWLLATIPNSFPRRVSVLNYQTQLFTHHCPRPREVNLRQRHQSFRVASWDVSRRGKSRQAPVTLGSWRRPRIAVSKSPSPSVPQLRASSWLPPLPRQCQDPPRRALQNLTATSWPPHRLATVSPVPVQPIFNWWQFLEVSC